MLMATYGCLLLFFGIKNTVYDYLTALETKLRLTFIVFMFSFVFPLLNIYILYKLKRLPALTLSERKDRTFPYLMTSLFYFGLYYLLMDISIWSTIKMFILGAAIAILFTALINMRYKISAHMVGIGGLLGALVAVSWLIRFDMTVYYMAVIIVAGIIGAARLSLKEHNPPQIYLGFMLGFFVQGGLFLAMQRMIFV